MESNEGKRIVQVSREVKRNYDSSIFMVKTSSEDILLLDRHGSRFLHRFGQDFISSPNNFKYNQNITAMVNHNGRIYVTTTKGELLAFDLVIKRHPYQSI